MNGSPLPLTLPHFPAALSAVPLGGIESVIVLVAFLCWAVYSVIAAYHWIAYGGFTHRGIPMLAVHVAVSAGVLLYAASGIVN